MNEISLAAGLMQVSRQKPDEAQKTMETVASMKRKIMSGYEKTAKKLKSSNQKKV